MPAGKCDPIHQGMPLVLLLYFLPPINLHFDCKVTQAGCNPMVANGYTIFL
jgi:hypothetical protein